MAKKWNKPVFSIRGESFLLLALMILILPLRWVIGFLAAALWHELCHVVAVYLCGGTIRNVSVSGLGAVMDTQPLPPWRELICTLAGPFGGMILLLFFGVFPRLAFCAAVHSVYNLLPLLPLDGARALRCVTQVFMPKRAVAICAGVEWGTRILILGISVLVGVVWNLGILPLLVMGRLLLPNTLKTPCNKALKAVQ